jgi:hypothetical protein
MVILSLIQLTQSWQGIPTTVLNESHETVLYNSSRRKPHAQYEHRAAQHPLLAATSGSPKRLVTAAILNNHLFDYSS